MNSIITKGSPELKNSLCKPVEDKIGEVKQSSSISNREISNQSKVAPMQISQCSQDANPPSSAQMHVGVKPARS
jgi:hypothetical protein